jgi:DNA polymerase elongation subunit (family B)
MRLKRGYTRFLHLGKMVADECPIQEKRLQSNAYGDNTLSTFQMKGRVVSDLFLYSKVNFKMTSYKLDVMAKAYIKDTAGKVVLSVPGWIEDSMAAVRQALLTLVPPDHEAVIALNQIPVAAAETAEELVIVDESDEEVEDKKEDVEHPYNALLRKSAAALTAAQSTPLLKEAFKQALTATGLDNYKKLHAINRMGAAARSAIAQYAMVDCDLTLQLMHAISAVPNMVQMSCVTHTLLMDIANRGQQIKVYNQLYRFGSDFVMNAPCSGWPDKCEYEGAHVIPPVPGFYQDPVVVLDFASLYPSIMQAKNLCFSTLCVVPPPPELRTDAYEISGRTYTFQRHERGVMPKILDGLLDARKATKNAMKGLSKSSLEYALLDGKQLALKVSANSCYGFLGVQTNGMYACVPAAAAVTMTGRGMIKRTQEYVISKGAVVIYGDTDSIMFTLPNVPRDEVFIKGPELAKGASALFEKPIKLEFEKVMEQYMLLKKKNYAGMMRTCIEDKGKLMAKGIASERRDNCSLVRTTMKKVLGAVMIDRDPTKAFGIVKSVLDNLKSNTIPIEELCITMSLKPEDSYVDPNGHAQLNVVRKMIARGAFNVPRPGDRVEYVIVESQAEKVSDRAEDPLFVVKNNIKLDRLYYLNNQLRTPILKIMEVLPVSSVKKLFEAAEADLGRQRLGVGRVTDFFASAAPPSTTDMPPRSYTLKSVAPPLSTPKPAKKQKLVQSNLTF